MTNALVSHVGWVVYMLFFEIYNFFFNSVISSALICVKAKSFLPASFKEAPIK